MSASPLSYSISQLEMGEAVGNVLSPGDTKDFICLGLPQAVTGVLSFTIAPLKYK